MAKTKSLGITCRAVWAGVKDGGCEGEVMVPPKNGRNVAQVVVNVGDLLLTVKTSEIS